MKGPSINKGAIYLFRVYTLGDARRTLWVMPSAHSPLRSRLFDPAAAWRSKQLSDLPSRARVVFCLRRKGTGRRGRARSCRASSRGHRDRHDGGQDPDGGGVQKHRLDFYRDESDAATSELSGNVWLDLTGAHWHYPPLDQGLVPLEHLVVPLEQADFGAAHQHGGAHGG